MCCTYPNIIPVREEENNAGLYYYWTTQTTHRLEAALVKVALIPPLSWSWFSFAS
jgi:hypothetical protein